MQPESAPRTRRPLVREVLLWLASAIGASTAIAAVLMVTLGITPIVFLSGSMTPTIEVGALALSQTTAISDIREGDIVSFIRADDARVTHRAESISVGDDGGVAITTKGDANSSVDDQPVVSAEVGRVIWSAPHLGAIATEILKPQWSFATGAAIGMIALFGFRRRPVTPSRAPDDSTPDSTPPAASSASRRRRRFHQSSPSEMLFLDAHPSEMSVAAVRHSRTPLPRKRRLVAALATAAAVLVIAGVAAAGAFAAPQSTLAAFSDSGASATIVMSAAAATVTPGTIDQDSIQCSGSAGAGYYDQKISWAAASPVAAYHTVVVKSSSGAYTFASTTSGTTTTIRMPRSAVDQWGNPVDSSTPYYGTYSVSITGNNGSSVSTPTYRTLAYAHWSPSNCFYAAQSGS